MRIATRLIIGFLLVAALVGVVGFFAINESQRYLIEAFGEGSATEAQYLINEIDTNIDLRSDEIKAYATDNLPRAALAESNSEFAQMENPQTIIDARDAEWVSLPKAQVTPFMSGLINNELAEELRSRVEFYEETHNLKIFGEIFVTNKYGANIAQSGKTSDYKQSDEGWWQSAVRDGSYIGDVEFDDSAGIYSMPIGVRVDDESGNFIGVIKAVLNIDVPISKIGQAGMAHAEMAHADHPNTNFMLLTRDGNIIYSSDGTPFGQNVPEAELFQEFSGDLGYFMAAPHEGSNDVSELVAYAHSKGNLEYKGLGWVMVIEHEVPAILAPVHQLDRKLLSFSLFAIALALLVGFFASNSIIKPVQELTKATQKMRRSNLNYKIKVKSKDEVGELAQTFEQMRLGLKDRSELLNSLTKTLNDKKLGGISAILMRRNVQELVSKNPRIYKILPKSLGKSIKAPQNAKMKRGKKR